jgi:phospholipid/cholesterol/gamma-HCH transport system substrate-binding protein
LIGDVAIDMQPGSGEGTTPTGNSPTDAPIIEGDVAPDPSKALAAATQVFEKAGDTLRSISEAATGLTKVTKSADKLDQLLTTWNGTGQDVTGAAQAIRRFIGDNEGNFKPALAHFRDLSQKLNETMDPATREALKSGIAKFSSAAGRIDSGMAEIQPALKDLGAPVSQAPKTDLGQTARRLNLVFADLELLTSKLRDAQGRLNTEGSLQKLLVQSDLHDNLNRMALSASQALVQLKTVLAAMRTFAEKVSSDPAAMMRGAMQR